VDYNDNGVRDTGEPFIDYNGNGKWDAPDGKQKDRLLWKAFRVVWSGEASITATGGTRTPHDSFMTATSGTSATLYLFDRNFNALAADGASATDGIGIQATCSDDAAPVSADIPMDQIHPGILFKADDGSISLPGSRSTWSQHIDYVIGFTGTTSPQSCTVTATPHRQYDPGAPGIDADGSDPDTGFGAAFSFHQ
jgi:hypothetical protein